MIKTKVLVASLCIITISGCLTPKGGTVLERQATVQQVQRETLEELYEKEPASKRKMEQAVGYGVFKKMGAAFLVAGSSNGFGIITDKETSKETYMKAVTGSAGFGFGIKQYRLVILFYDTEVMNRFVSTGWDFGTQASATLTSNAEGGEANSTGTFKRSMDVYEFTKEGIFLRADVKATRFSPDKSMNLE